MDYRPLNWVTIGNQYPLSLINELLERLHSTRIFTKLELCHDSWLAGHFSQTKTRDLVLWNFWWLGIHSYVRKYTDSCNLCFWSKNHSGSMFSLLQPLPTPSQPWSVSLDLILLPWMYSCAGLYQSPDQDSTIYPLSHGSYCPTNCPPLSWTHLPAPQAFPVAQFIYEVFIYCGSPN